ncbi:MAG: translocation/assembly module TamB, partial [Deltaproteobacteria bacterium]|nr:translocation/assembly module TamB [Deltaproteobacteria bacterium]
MTKTITKILKSTATIISSVIATFSCVIVLLKLLEIWLEFYLFALLETEVRLSTGCSLKAGKWDINIFSLTGHASNTRVECAGQLKILTNLMKGEFSLKNIPRGIIDLKLIVEGGWSDGFWEESSLYKLIDFLALEPSKPPIVRLRLNRLDVFSYKTSGEFLGVNIKTEDAKINYLRKKDDFLALKIQFSHMNANELVFRDGELIFDLNDIVALRSGQTQIDNLTVKAYGLFNHRDEINLELKDEIGTSTISVIKDETEFSQRERSKIKEQSTIRVKSFGSIIEIGQFALKNHQVDLTLSEFEDNLLKSEKNLYFVFLLFHALLSTAKGSIKIGTLFGNDSIKINDLEILLKQKEAEISIGGIHLGQVKVHSLQLIASIEGGNLILDVSKPFKGLIRFETNTKTITSENLLFHSIKLSNIRFVIKENDIIGQLSALGHNFEFNLGDQLRVRNDLKSFDLVFDKNLNANFNDFSISLACFNLRISGQLIDYPKLSLRIDLLKVFINCNNLNEVIELRDVAIPLDAFKIHTVLTSNFGKFNFGAKGKPTAFLIHLTGETNLNFFVRDLMPGLITSIPTKLDFEAVFDNFKLVDLRGFFNIKDGFAYHANGLLRVDKFSGNAQIIPSGINIEIFNGTVNEGFLNFTGQINFDGSYNISGQFKNVSFKWQDMLQSKLTGDFRFAHNERIKINLGLEEGSISIPEDSVIDSIIQRTKSEKFQDILKIVSDFNAELNVETLNPISLTSAKITTQLWGRANMIYGKQPSITGEINMLGGNLTISSNIFDIKRGLVRFSETGTPSIEILASRLFFYSKNFPVEVNANIYGDLFSPTVELYSVPSLEQEEIQKIVFARDPAFFNLNPRGVTIFKDSNTPLNLISKTFLKEFFPSAVSFDVKPVEGERTAYVLHIGKDLLRNLKLLGESAFFDNYSVNSVKLNFSVLDHLSLIGEISNNPLLPRTGFSFDILYSVFESGGDPIFKFKGNAQLNSEKLMAALPTLKFAPTQVLDSLAKALVREYIKNGYLNAKVKVTCKEIFESYCKKIEFYIDEGRQNLIGEIITQSDLRLYDFIGKPLTEETLVSLIKKYQLSLLEKNFLVSDIDIKSDCNHNQTHNSCSLRISHQT